MTRTLLAALVALTSALPASAAINMGPAELKPYYGLETRYEDNIYRVPKDQNNHAVAGGGVRGSAIVSNNLGVKIAVPLEQHKVTALYDFTAENYAKQSKANSAYNQKFGLGYGYTGSKIKAKLDEYYENTQDPAFNPNGTVTNGALVSRERRWRNSVSGSAEYSLDDSFFFGVDADWTINRYLNRAGGVNSLANLLNTTEGTFGFKTGYRIQPKTRAYVALHRKMVHYTEEVRQDNHRDFMADFGVDGEFTEKLKGRVQLGYQYLAFDQDNGPIGTANHTRDRIGRVFAIATSLDFLPAENTKTNLTVNRSASGSSSTQAKYFTSAGVSLSVTQQMGKASVGVNGGYQQDKYSQDFTIGTFTHARRDDNYNAGVKADYKFNEMIAAGAFFTRTARFSTFSREFSYKDAITGANLKLTF